jgi:hypothetical protein
MTLWSLALAAVVAVSASAAEPAKPNVLIVMTDDQRLGDFSLMGNPVLKTPDLGAFQGVGAPDRLPRLPHVQPHPRAIADRAGGASERGHDRAQKANVADKHPW